LERSGELEERRREEKRREEKREDSAAALASVVAVPIGHWERACQGTRSTALSEQKPWPSTCKRRFCPYNLLL